jgi:hypothetical protein
MKTLTLAGLILASLAGCEDSDPNDFEEAADSDQWDIDADTDTDVDGDVDGDSDGDTDADVDADTDGDADSDSDSDSDSDTDGDTEDTCSSTGGFCRTPVDCLMIVGALIDVNRECTADGDICCDQTDTQSKIGDYPCPDIRGVIECFDNGLGHEECLRNNGLSSKDYAPCDEGYFCCDMVRENR